MERFRVGITPYYASLMDPDDPNCPVRKQAVPTIAEDPYQFCRPRGPLLMKTKTHQYQELHRYPDKVLFLITDQCSMYCRHCTRRRFAGQHDMGVPRDKIDAGIEYIRRTPQVRDVLLSGGDALLVSDDLIGEYIIKKLREIPHVEIIRIGSKYTSSMSTENSQTT